MKEAEPGENVEAVKGLDQIRNLVGERMNLGRNGVSLARKGFVDFVEFVGGKPVLHPNEAPLAFEPERTGLQNLDGWGPVRLTVLTFCFSLTHELGSHQVPGVYLLTFESRPPEAQLLALLQLRQCSASRRSRSWAWSASSSRLRLRIRGISARQSSTRGWRGAGLNRRCGIASVSQ